jgi:mRNA interferase MazF
MYHRGDVVLLPFPFTDLSATRTRPAVVVSVPEFTQAAGDFMVAMITSVPHTTRYDYELQDWQAARLLRPPGCGQSLPRSIRHWCATSQAA